jgi:uncharacterized linocin/CFP29 family protein
MKRNTKTAGRRMASRAGAGVAGIVSTGQQFMGSAGRWATERLKAAALQGKLLTSALRTADVLLRDEWLALDAAVLEEAYIRLVGVADLKARNLQVTIANGLGKTVYEYEKMTAFDDADVSMSGLNSTGNDIVEYSPVRRPLPFTHKDFYLDLRQLSASRERGEALDVTNTRQATRVVSEMSEKLLFQGYTGKFGGYPIYGYMTEPNRNTASFDGGKNWGNASKAGTSFVTDVINMLSKAEADRFYGPFVIYVPRDADVNLDNDYNTSGGNNQNQTIRARLLQFKSVQDIVAADQLPTGNVLLVQMTPDVVRWVEGEPLQVIQWDEVGGLKINFKTFTIGIPDVRSDAANRSGIVHMS